jgi:hypothetical protein
MDTSQVSQLTLDDALAHIGPTTLVAVAAIGAAVLIGGVLLDRALHPASR